MVFTFAALTALSLFSQPYAPETDFKLDMSAPYFSQETAKRPKGDNRRIADIIYAKILAHTLYTQMEQKENIFVLFFESYGGKHKGFYVERNLPDEPRHLILHADDQKNGITAAITVHGKLSSIDSVILKKFEGGKPIKKRDISPEDKDALLLYRRMLEASVWHIGGAEVSRDPVGFNIAKYGGHIKDDEFVSSLENLISKANM